MRPGHGLGGKDGKAVRGAAAALLAAPIVLLPGLAWGAAGRLEPVQYPAVWSAARSTIDSNRSAGGGLLLPWAAYRRFGWNGNEAALDPWPQLLRRGVIWNDGLQIGAGITVPPEDPQASALNRLILSAAPLTGRLQAVGITYVVVDAGFARSLPAATGVAPTESYPYRRRLPGCKVVLAAPDLVVYRVPPSGTATR